MHHFITFLMLVIGLLAGHAVGNYMRNAPQREAIEKCEQPLPREQHCKLIFTAEVVK